MHSQTAVPSASSFTSAPLRNRIQVQLNTPLEQVWALVGDPARLPDYSAGLERVEANKSSAGIFTDYVCHFRPHVEGGEGMVHKEEVRWYETNRGYASSGEKDNPFGITNDLNLITVEPSPEGTLLTWEVYFDASDVAAMRGSYDEALADIGSQLVARFGGRVLERYAEQ